MEAQRGRRAGSVMSPSIIDAATIAIALHGRKSGRGWLMLCPAHNERTPSCSITDANDGRVLVHCFAGCRQIDVIAALRSMGLWPEREQTYRTAEEKRQFARRLSMAESLARRVSDWQRAKSEALEAAKRLAGDDEATLELAARASYFHDCLGGAALLAAFRNDLDAGKFEAIGRDDREHAERVTAALIVCIALTDRRRATA
ncbi:MAG: CHC2 zinc finger domain-containing protein [Acidobacteriota bacterium]